MKSPLRHWIRRQERVKKRHILSLVALGALPVMCGIMWLLWRIAPLRQYTIVALELPEGFESSHARAINNEGWVLGQVWDASRARRTVSWIPNMEIKSLPCIMARDINDKGQVDGYTGASGPMGPYTYLIADGTPLVRKGPEKSGMLQANNNLGQAVGIAGDTAVLWEFDGKVTYLGTLGGDRSQAWGINNKSRVVGHAQVKSGGFHAFIWDATEGMRDLGTLGFSESMATDINDWGLVVGFLGKLGELTQSFIWSASEGMKDIGTLGFKSGSAASINNTGQVVGVYDSTSFFQSSVNGLVKRIQALRPRWNWLKEIQKDLIRILPNERTESSPFLWERGSMHDLNILLPAGATWERLSSAIDINDRGQIVGHGILDGKERAYVMTPVPDNQDRIRISRRE